MPVRVESVVRFERAAASAASGRVGAGPDDPDTPTRALRRCGPTKAIRRPMRARPGTARVLLLLVFGIGMARGAEASDPDLRSAASWCATAARAIRGWGDASLPERYVRRTLTIAVTELHDLDRSATGHAAATAHARIGAAIAVVRRVADAAEQGDRIGAMARVGELDRQADALVARR